MTFIEELQWRGMVHDMTPGLDEFLAKNKIKAYIGFDPTAPSLTIGNYVQIMSLTHLQKAGHIPVVLMGGATGRIGDPSFKDEERSLKTSEEIEKNLNHQKKQFHQLLNFESGDNRAIMVNNYDFYKDMNALDFLRDAGKTLTVNYMMAKESVKKRIDTGLSFTEFSYQILQGYDFQLLYEKFGIKLQMGGSDQWGNITTGTEFIRRNLGEKAYALTSPLLTKADGSKFGKSTEGNIWLDPELTSPYKFYQFWINTDDRDIEKYLKIFSLKSIEELQGIFENETDPRNLKKILAEELTIRIHGEENFKSVLKVSELLFNNKVDRAFVLDLSPAELHAISQEIPMIQISLSEIEKTGFVSQLVGDDNMFKSNGDARRAIKGNALAVNKEKVKNIDFVLDKSDILHEKYVLLENGKKNKYIAEVQ
ncbi:tyrosine--tRNA ligase [Membranihabitans maritimus]|uniref:tyrosine--tRNA ligase n=1 Tax=Membranihabitans maritimus TaxID=2904244 RepID=UPI001EFFF172|nr:tyrosine--tRNA ligase [Membranihabitans maritimus]